MSLLNSKPHLVFGRQNSGVLNPSRVLLSSECLPRHSVSLPFVLFLPQECSLQQGDGLNHLLSEGSALKADGFFSCTNPCQLKSPTFTSAWGPYIIYKTLTNTADPASMDWKLEVPKAWKTTSSKANTALCSPRCFILMDWFRGVCFSLLIVCLSYS